MNTTNYKLEAGDTVRITGCHGRLFSGNGGKRTLADGVELGVECVLIGDEDYELDVKLPEGILDEGAQYIHLACVELVKKGKREATIAVIDEHKVITVSNGNSNRWVAKIWYDCIPKEVANKCASIIKEAYDTSVLNNPPPRDLRKLL